MADAQPLNKQIPIIDPVSGCPTDYFIKWAQQFNSSALGEIFAGAGIGISAGPTITADQQAILDAIDNTQGSILYRDANEWKALAPGTAGYFLKTNGASANPQWAAGGGGFTPTPPVYADFTRATNHGGGARAFTDLTTAVYAQMTTSGTSHQGFFYGIPITPDVPFTAIARVTNDEHYDNWACAGLAVQASSGSQMAVLGTGSFSSNNTVATLLFGVSNMSNNTTAPGHTGTVVFARINPYYKLVFDGTDLHGFASYDSVTWIPTRSVPAANVFGGDNPLYVGIGAYITGRVSGTQVGIVCDSLEITYQ